MMCELYVALPDVWQSGVPFTLTAKAPAAEVSLHRPGTLVSSVEDLTGQVTPHHRVRTAADNTLEQQQMCLLMYYVFTSLFIHLPVYGCCFSFLLLYIIFPFSFYNFSLFLTRALVFSLLPYYVHLCLSLSVSTEVCCSPPYSVHRFLCLFLSVSLPLPL